MINWEQGKLGELKKAGMPIPPTFVISEATEQEIKEAYTSITINPKSEAQEFMEEKEEYVVVKNSEVFMNIKGKESGNTILPQYWEDNYFSLLPGERRTINGDLNKKDLRGEHPELNISGWNI